MTALDSTGFQSHHVSQYFSFRKCTLDGDINHIWRKRYPKLWALIDCETHLILSIHTGRGPGNDQGGFLPTLRAAKQFTAFQLLLADAGFDSEDNHSMLKKMFSAKALIPPTKGRKGVIPSKPHRRRMYQAFLDQTPPKFKSRWQVETVVSMIKRNLRHALSAKNYWSQCAELALLAISHNLLILFF